MSNESPESLSLPSFSFPSGDVTVLVHVDDDAKWLASSAALSTASPVWSKFLFPLWSTDSSVPVKEIDCSNDDLFALAILFDIAHMKFRSVPDNINLQQLYQIAILLDQYACIELVQPWLKGWLAGKKKTQRENKDIWLLIAWVFGLEDTFVELARKVVREAKIDEEGNYLSKEGKIMSDPMPHGLIGTFFLLPFCSSPAVGGG